MKEWGDVRKELFTPEEIRKCDLRVDIISTFINARNQGQITQEEFEQLLERFENIANSENTTVQDKAGTHETLSPLDTVLHMMAPFGKTLTVMPVGE